MSNKVMFMGYITNRSLKIKILGHHFPVCFCALPWDFYCAPPATPLKIFLKAPLKQNTIIMVLFSKYSSSLFYGCKVNVLWTSFKSSSWSPRTDSPPDTLNSNWVKPIKLKSACVCICLSISPLCHPPTQKQTQIS